MRTPASYRELIASCLRSVYMGDPFASGPFVAPKPSRSRSDEVQTSEYINSGIRCVVYRPTKLFDKSPAIIYMHGGGFVVGCSEDTDFITRKLCLSNNMIVISVNYGLSPETIFPGALTDCEEVLKSVVRDSEKLSLDPEQIYIAGDSAGANLALGLFQKVALHQPHIKGLILLAPWLDMEVEQYDSYNRLAPDGIVFDAAFIAYARAAYTRFEEWKNPLVSPLFCKLQDLPSTIVLIGTADPLLDQSLALDQKAKLNNCSQIEVHTYAEMPHCFYSFENLYLEEALCFEQISRFISRTRVG
ncbi:unnamed protein product [Sphagnum balticum]